MHKRAKLHHAINITVTTTVKRLSSTHNGRQCKHCWQNNFPRLLDGHVNTLWMPTGKQQRDRNKCSWLSIQKQKHWQSKCCPRGSLILQQLMIRRQQRRTANQKNQSMRAHRTGYMPLNWQHLTLMLNWLCDWQTLTRT